MSPDMEQPLLMGDPGGEYGRGCSGRFSPDCAEGAELVSEAEELVGQAVPQHAEHVPEAHRDKGRPEHALCVTCLWLGVGPGLAFGLGLGPNPSPNHRACPGGSSARPQRAS